MISIPVEEAFSRRRSCARNRPRAVQEQQEASGPLEWNNPPVTDPFALSACSAADSPFAAAQGTADDLLSPCADKPHTDTDAFFRCVGQKARRANLIRLWAQTAGPPAATQAAWTTTWAPQGLGFRDSRRDFTARPRIPGAVHRELLTRHDYRPPKRGFSLQLMDLIARPGVSYQPQHGLNRCGAPPNKTRRPTLLFADDILWTLLLQRVVGSFN